MRLSLIGLLSGLALLALHPLSLAAADVTPPPAAPPSARLQLAQNPIPEEGLYEASDDLQFLLDRKDGQVRMRFLGSEEVFYLVSEPAPLGGRVLKYDTGNVALQVAGWGGVTLYTDQARSGLPAERSGDAPPVDPTPIAAADVKNFAVKLAQELSARDDFAIGFVADWESLAADDARAAAVDAMRNATYALDAAAKGPKRSAISDRIHIVRAAAGAKPGVAVQKGVLVVTYAVKGGALARPSSLAILHAVEAGV